jgi:hypothetical protein
MSRDIYPRMLRGWFGGCLMATAVIEVFVLCLVALAGVRRMAVLSPADFFFAILIGVPLILVFVCVLTAIPAAIAIWLAERFHIRSLLFYACAGGVIGALSESMLFSPCLFSACCLSWPGVSPGLTIGMSRDATPVAIVPSAKPPRPHLPAAAPWWGRTAPQTPAGARCRHRPS